MPQLGKITKQFVGIPYEKGCQTYKSCDCYGLIKLFYIDIFGIDLDLRRTNDDPIKENMNEIHKLFYEPTTRLVFGDIITFLKPITTGDSFHAGIAINENYLLHTDSEHGSCIHRFNRYLFKDSMKHIFRLKKEVIAEIERKKGLV